MPRKRKYVEPNRLRRYSVKLDIPENAKRASRKCIKHFVMEAVRSKQWAIRVLCDDGWMRRACDYSVDMAIDYNASSVHVIARQALEYERYRAHLTHNGNPIDLPSRNLWLSLNF